MGGEALEQEGEVGLGELPLERGGDLLIVVLEGQQPVGFQNSATVFDQAFYAARSYSLMRPPRTGWRLIRS